MIQQIFIAEGCFVVDSLLFCGKALLAGRWGCVSASTPDPASKCDEFGFLLLLLFDEEGWMFWLASLLSLWGDDVTSPPPPPLPRDGAGGGGGSVPLLGVVVAIIPVDAASPETQWRDFMMSTAQTIWITSNRMQMTNEGISVKYLLHQKSV